METVALTNEEKDRELLMLADWSEANGGWWHTAGEIWLARAELAKAHEAELNKIAARYRWLVSKIFTRGETCLALYEEFGGAPFEGESKRQFVDRFIDAEITNWPKVEPVKQEE